MKRKTPNQNQRNLSRPILKEFINPNHELEVWVHKVYWHCFEDSFSSLYSYMLLEN